MSQVISRLRCGSIALMALLVFAFATPPGEAQCILAEKLHNDPNGNGILNRGQQLQYTIRIRTLANPVTGVSVMDVIPAGVTFVRVDDSAGGNVISTTPVLQIDNISIPALSVALVVFTVQEDGTGTAGTNICNVANVTCPPNPPLTTAQACIALPPPPPAVVFVEKSHSNPNGNGILNRGQTLQYTVRVFSVSQAATVSIVDPIPAGVDFVSLDTNGGGTVVSTTPTLEITGIAVPAGGQQLVTFTVRENGTQPFNALVCNDVTMDSPANPGPLSSRACIGIEPPPPSVVFVEKSHSNPNGNGLLNRSQTLQYTIRLFTLNQAATARIVDPIPAGVDFVSLDTNGGGTVVSTTPTLEITGIAVPSGGNQFVTFTVRENGTQPFNALVCNDVTMDSAANPLPLMSRACINIQPSPPLNVLVEKFHNDPNGDGFLDRGQSLQYTISIRTLGQAANDIRIVDPIPAGVDFVSLDQNGGGTVVSTTPIVDITGIGLAAASVTTVVFTVVENGSLPDGAVLCNQVTLETTANPIPVMAQVCINLRGGGICVVGNLTPRTLLKGVKDPSAGPNAVTFEWSTDPFAVEYHVNSVLGKTDLTATGPRQDGVGVLQCSSPSAGCSDLNALSDPAPELFYQVLSACGAAPSDEGPVF